VATREVELGIELPGIAGVSVTTTAVDGRTLLSAIRPSPRPSSSRVSARRPVALHDLLVELEVDGAVPVLVEGTPFTLAVLGALVGVAAGERCSYAELAARAGRPRAVRAAAHVMATNRVPLVLPCHRVVPSGGGTGRHGWGDAVKPVLLDAERCAAA
jgi:O-6-methylguanine DNA methyltransferase